MLLHPIIEVVENPDDVARYRVYGQDIPFVIPDDDFSVEQIIGFRATGAHQNLHHPGNHHVIEVVQKQLRQFGRIPLEEMTFRAVTELLERAQEFGINDPTIATLEPISGERFLLRIHRVTLWEYRSPALYEIVDQVCKDICKAAHHNYAQRPTKEEVSEKVNEMKTLLETDNSIRQSIIASSAQINADGSLSDGERPKIANPASEPTTEDLYKTVMIKVAYYFLAAVA